MLQDSASKQHLTLQAPGFTDKLSYRHTVLQATRSFLMTSLQVDLIEFYRILLHAVNMLVFFQTIGAARHRFGCIAGQQNNSQALGLKTHSGMES